MSMNCTLSFEHFCKHCGECVLFTAVSIPDGVDEEYIEHYYQHSYNDCCYKCYMLLESTQDAVAKSQKKKIEIKSK